MGGWCNLEAFIKAYCPPSMRPIKFPFCYEYLDGIERLTKTQLPTQHAFYSRLKRKGITDEEYQFVQQLLVEKGFKTIGDYLQFYNEADVKYFLHAVLAYKRFWDEWDVDCYKQALFLPGLSITFGFDLIEHGTTLFTFNQPNIDLYWTVRNNIVGGPAIVFQRYSHVGRSIINEKNLVQSIAYYDSNSLYLCTMAEHMPGSNCLRSIYSRWRRSP